jgi:hypothetical protein
MSFKKLAIIIVLVVFATGAGTLAARWPLRDVQQPVLPEQTLPEQRSLTIDPEHLDFGERWIDSKELTITLPLRNDSAHVIRIDSFQTSCNCESIKPSNLTLQPNEKRDICLTLTDLVQPEFLGRPRSIQSEVRPVIDGKIAKGWSVRGVVRPRIESNLTAVLFGESNRIGRSPVPRTLIVRFHQPGMASVRLTPEVADVEARPDATAIEWTIIISPRTDRQPGPFQGVLTISNIPLGGGDPVASLELPVAGVLQEVDR